MMRVDLVHLHLAGQVSLLRKLPIALCAKTLGIPFIAHLHASSAESLFEHTPSWAYRFLLGSARRVVALSESWAASIRHHVPKAEVVVVPNPVRSFPSPAAQPRRDRAQAVLFVGKLEPRKGYHDLLAAAPLLLPAHPELQFWFAGNGDLKHAEELARGLGIERSVRLLGWTGETELTRLYSEATIVCLPSYSEGVPMSVLEAMSHGVPVVCTPVGGLPELIEHGRNGLFATAGDPQSIARQIDCLLTHPEPAARIAAAAAITVRQKCGLDLVSDKLATLYAEVMEST
jgi:glycosyltransferase involved in cell wall biosynthesis